MAEKGITVVFVGAQCDVQISHKKCPEVIQCLLTV